MEQQLTVHIVGICRFLSVFLSPLPSYNFYMKLSFFSDLYIISECHRLNGILNNMPRYRIGMHNGSQSIRLYSGTGSGIIRKEVHENGRDFASMLEKLDQFNKLTERKKLFDSELHRRRLTIPADFKMCRDISPFNIDAWKQFVPCSNNYENRNQYIDPYGFNVKSRSEMLVGNALKDLGLEAKYEPLLILRGGRKKTPDYSFPVPVIDRCFFIEFVGMADDGNYIDSNYGKIDEYMRNGILPNRDLILICGTENWLPSLETMKILIASFINSAVFSVYEKADPYSKPKPPPHGAGAA